MIGFFRVRLLSHVLVSIPGLALAGLAIKSLALTLSNGDDQGLIPVLTFLPAALAGIIGVASGSSMAELERTSTRGIRFWSLVYPLLMGALGIVALIPLVDTGGADYGPWVLVRNTFGLIGLGLITARVLGVSKSWIGPIAFSVTLISVEGVARLGTWWTWLTLPYRHRGSWIVASAFLGLGLVAIWNKVPLEHRIGAANLPTSKRT